MSIRISALLALAVGLALTGAAPAVAQDDYPTRPITMIVPYSPGGSTDLTARLVAQELEEELGQSIVISNKPGAAAMLGLNELVEAQPDGYTIGMTNSGMVLQPLYGIAQHNYATDLQGVAQIGEIPFVLAVPADSPFETIEDLVAHASGGGEAITLGITGVGNTAHIGPENLALQADIDFDPVNFDGGGPLVAALLGGHIQAAGNNPVDLKEHVRAGTIRVLLVFGEERLKDPLYADVPTAKEKGYDVVVTLWQGVGAPLGLPEAVLARLDAAFQAVLSDPDTQAAITELGLEPAPMNAADFSAKWVADQDKMEKVVTDTGILDIIKSQTN